jgi:hypothetical protein
MCYPSWRISPSVKFGVVTCTLLERCPFFNTPHKIAKLQGRCGLWKREHEIAQVFGSSETASQRAKKDANHSRASSFSVVGERRSPLQFTDVTKNVTYPAIAAHV